MADQIQEIARLLCIQSNGDGLMSKIRQTIELLQEAAAERDQMRTELGDGTTGNKYRAELYDEVWQKARDMGYGNVTEALADLARTAAQRDAILQQARSWAGEAKTQRSTVLEVGEILGGIPDWGPIAAGVEAMAAELAHLRAGQEPAAEVKESQYLLGDTSDEISELLPIGTKLYTTPQPSAVPDGWTVKRASDDEIIVQHESIGGCVVSSSPEHPRQIPETILYHLAETMLAAAPSAPATVQGVNQQLLEALDRISKMATELECRQIPCSSFQRDFAGIAQAADAAIAAARQEGGK